MPLRVYDLSVALFDAGCIKFGEFILKSGIPSPIYIDLRILVSKPSLLRKIGAALGARVRSIGCDGIAGIPYAGIPLAVVASQDSGRPMIYPRKEVKDYGTKKSIEGVYQEGDTYLVIDDLITDGKSKIEAIKPLEDAGLYVYDILVILDREQGGEKILATKGYRLHSLCKLSQVLHSLVSATRIGPETEILVNEWISNNQFS